MQANRLMRHRLHHHRQVLAQEPMPLLHRRHLAIGVLKTAVHEKVARVIA